jgi:hypothetical protein
MSESNVTAEEKREELGAAAMLQSRTSSLCSPADRYVRDVNESVQCREYHAKLTVAEFEYFDEYKRRQNRLEQQFEYANRSDITRHLVTPVGATIYG